MLSGKFELQKGIYDEDLFGALVREGLVIDWQRTPSRWNVVSQLDIPWGDRIRTHRGGTYAKPRWKYVIRLDVVELVRFSRLIREKGIKEGIKYGV